MNMKRISNCLSKPEHMNKALRHEERDRVTVNDFLWDGFIKRWRDESNLPDDTNPYNYFDFDRVVTTPNMDTLIRLFEIDSIEKLATFEFEAAGRQSDKSCNQLKDLLLKIRHNKHSLSQLKI